MSEVCVLSTFLWDVDPQIKDLPISFQNFKNFLEKSKIHCECKIVHNGSITIVIKAERSSDIKELARSVSWKTISDYNVVEIVQTKMCILEGCHCKHYKPPGERTPMYDITITLHHDDFDANFEYLQPLLE